MKPRGNGRGDSRELLPMGAAMTETLVFAFHDDMLYAFQRTDTYSASVFGGPSRATVDGIAFGPKPLHLIARLGARHLPPLNNHCLFDLPLIYGMYYGGCRLSYRVHYGHHVELLHIAGSAPHDECRDFPALLPYIPLQPDGAPQPASYNEFAARFPNMPARQRAEMIIAVPPPASIGLSLWGDYGDGGGVTIVFECDLKNRTVSASNVTS